MGYREIEKAVLEIKDEIAKEFKKQNYENVLSFVSLCANVLYQTNFCYFDEDLETIIKKSADILIKVPDEYTGKDDVVLFWDGFGFNTRGLAQIYIRALVEQKRVIYITYEERKNDIPDILNVINENRGCYQFIKRTTYLDQIIQLEKILKEFQPEHFFFYSVPNDVVATVIMHGYMGKMRRYQINLTDHAFWLGAKALDVCIEFRNYGANISLEHRNIEKKNIVIIPYYPIIDKTKEFAGYPFDFDEKKQKLIFSGGSLYKTLGGENQYYKILDSILCRYKEVVFWYAGTGDRRKIDDLIKKYPNRVFVTEERTDLYQIMRRCRFYLSTFPMVGGLMLQYACAAGRVPITLRFDECADGILLEQDKIGVYFNEKDGLLREVDKLLADDNYAALREDIMKSAVISPNEFTEEIRKIFTGEKGKYDIDVTHIESLNFRQQYWNRYDVKKIARLFLSKKKYVLYLIHFKKRVITGSIYAFIDRCSRLKFKS